jgi:hypothetical protein
MSRRKAGRPTKADLDERERRKAKAEEHDRHRAAMEAAIARGGLWLPADAVSPFSPATQFILDRVHQVTADQFDDAMRATMLALLRSDVPLDPDPDIRRQIANTWERERRTKQQERLDEGRAFIDHVDMMKKHLGERGLTMGEAEKKIAKARGWKPGTFQRNLRLARARLKAAK